MLKNKAYFILFSVLFIFFFISCDKSENTQPDKKYEFSDTGEHINHLKEEMKNEETRYEAQLELVKLYIGMGETQIAKRELEKIPEENEEVAELYRDLFNVIYSNSRSDGIDRTAEIDALLNEMTENMESLVRPAIPVLTVEPGSYEDYAVVLMPDLEKLDNAKLYMTIDGTDPLYVEKGYRFNKEPINGILISESGEYDVRAIAIAETYDDERMGIPSREFRGTYKINIKPQKEIIFKNPLLEEWTRKKLRKPEGPIYDTDVAKIKYCVINYTIPEEQIEAGNDYYSKDYDSETDLPYIVRYVDGKITEKYENEDLIHITGSMEDLKYFTGVIHLSFSAQVDFVNFEFLKGMPLLQILSFDLYKQIDTALLKEYNSFNNLSLTFIEEEIDIAPLLKMARLKSLNLYRAPFDFNLFKTADPKISRLKTLAIKSFEEPLDISILDVYKNTLMTFRINNRVNDYSVLKDLKKLKFLMYKKEDVELIREIKDECPHIREWFEQ